ncbi:MAG: hypothetical protein GQ582_06865 [Methyloprofundus sp.]|nr:hypothetical protein [Methyloprofundus sp.]
MSGHHHSAGMLNIIMRKHPKTFLSLCIQLGLITCVVSLFNIEEHLAIHKLMPVVFSGFILHANLAKRWRPPFFLILSFFSIGLILGLQQGVILITLVLVFFALCHLPYSLLRRSIIIISLAGVLALFRAEVLPNMFPIKVLVVLGSILMFRIILYLYELQYEKEQVNIWQRLNYFFLLPNIIFPIFPVVDYKTFKNTYYNQAELKIYQRGINLMFKGLFHLMLYRVIYNFYVPALTEVIGIFSLAWFVISSYLLILRLSGMLHFIIGILCLFGYNLPEIFNNYFLARGFGDFWRRINIYWKDFVIKIFYYPLFFRLRKKGTVFATFSATLIVFAINWFLHNYQWFWIMGEFSIAPTDLLFWGIFGVLVTVSVLLPNNKGTDEHTYRRDFILVSQVTATFISIALLWSLWISPSLASWLSLMATAGNSSVQDIVYFLLGLVSFLFIISSIQYFICSHQGYIELYQQTVHRSAPYRNIILLSFCVVLGSNMGLSFLHQYGSFSLSTMMKTRLNHNDTQSQFNGYYQDMLKDKNFSSPLWQIQQQRSKSWAPLRKTSLIKKTDNMLMYQLLPNQNAIFRTAFFQTNRFGLRDKEYPLLPDNNSTRIALLGGSIEMGAGVANTEIFEALVEDKLNSAQDSRHYEILNFATGEKNTLHHLYRLKHEVIDFQPRYLVIFQHSREWLVIVKSIQKFIKEKGSQAHDFPFVENIIKKENLQPNLKLEEYFKRLEPYKHEIFQQTFKRMLTICQQHEIVPILVYLPSLEQNNQVPSWQYVPILGLAKKAGFHTIDMSTVYDNHPKNSLWAAPWDSHHPNAQGHQLIAQRLYDELVGFLYLNSNEYTPSLSK